MMSSLQVVTALVFVATYVGVALGRLPFLRMDRAGIALVGAAVMVGIGALPLADALRAVDLETLALLLGMMIVVANLKLSGFFRLAGSWATARAHSPLVLLAMIVVVTGVLSAILVNDAVCLAMAPLVVAVTRALGRNPIPYLIAVATASNVGSTATITGNPQNMIIGSLSQIPYTVFTAALAPVALVGLALVIGVLVLLHRGEFAGGTRLAAAPVPTRIHAGLMVKVLLVTLAVVAAFLIGVPVAEAAILGGAVLLVTRAVKPWRVYREIDGALLLMFAGLFVVTAAAEKVLLGPDIVAKVQSLGLQDAWVLAGITTVLSNLVSNVPAVLVLRPFVTGLPDPDRAWLVVAMSSTLAGNLTLLGSVANLIVAERARAEGVEITFSAYLKVGLPLTLATLAFGTWWLAR